MMALSIKNNAVVKVVQGTHRQGNVRYGTCRGIQCSCMPLMPVTWILFKSPGIWNKFDLDCILCKGDQYDQTYWKIQVP